MGRRRDDSLKQSLPGLRRIHQRLWPYMRQQRGLMVWSMLSLILGVGMRLLEPWPLKFVFDRVIDVGRGSDARFESLSAFSTVSPQRLILTAALILFAITTLRAIFEYITTVAFAKIGNRVVTALRNDLYRHVQRLDLGFHMSSRGGDLVIRVINDVNNLRDAASTAMLPLVANALVLVGMWSVMFALQWKLGVLAMATLPLLWLRTIRQTGRIRDAARKQRQRQGDLAAATSEGISSIKIIQAFSLERRFSGSFDESSQSSGKQDVRTARLSAGLERSVDVLLALATALVLWYGATLVLRRELSPGDLLIYLTYLRRAFNPMQDFAKYTGRIAKAAASGERVLDLLDRHPKIRDLPDARPAPAFHGAVRFDGVTFRYGRDNPIVLEGVDLDIRPGERVALVGPSGTGKSTMANLLLRLYDPEDGRVMIDGVDVRTYTVESLRRQVSVILQESVLFAASVRDNIAYGGTDCSDEQVQDAARLANAHEFISALPAGYDTVLSERGASLSGGQRQRIAIARAAVRRAPIILLDEPTTGLDEESERVVNDALARLAVGRTTILITHGLRQASSADRIAYIEDRRVRECGSHAELMRLDGRYAAMYRLQLAAEEVQRGATGQVGHEETHALVL